MAPPSVHSFYRIWFTWVDPAAIVPTVYFLLVDPTPYMNALIPSSMSVANPDHAFLFHALAALYAFLAVQLIVTLRITDDIKVWSVFQAGILMVDFALIASQYVCIKQQGRLHMEGLRHEDWGAFIFTALVAVIRIAFLTGIGAKSPAKTTKRA
ncbi:hypothetical protein LIA77_08032 [Sarocladium implicatum]|jgi:hypothetical protein|nr:hypothetical protein LIA77_08032 [Sarocladium implicatum]